MTARTRFEFRAARTAAAAAVLLALISAATDGRA
jgi:hypothetical protein